MRMIVYGAAGGNWWKALLEVLDYNNHAVLALWMLPAALALPCARACCIEVPTCQILVLYRGQNCSEATLLRLEWVQVASKQMQGIRCLCCTKDMSPCMLEDGVLMLHVLLADPANDR